MRNAHLRLNEQIEDITNKLITTDLVAKYRHVQFFVQIRQKRVAL